MINKNGFDGKILQNKNLKNNNFLPIILLAFTLTVRQKRSRFLINSNNIIFLKANFLRLSTILNIY